MPIDPEVTKIGFTICATAITTVMTVAKSFFGEIRLLNSRIDSLSKAIFELDKNVAVQTAVFQRHMKEEEKLT